MKGRNDRSALLTMQMYFKPIIALGAAITLSVGCTTLSDRNEIGGKSGARTSVDKEHVIVAGDRLVDIALEYTGASEYWREIAQYNQIDDPKALQIGGVIVIPASLLGDPEQPQTNSDRRKQADVDEPVSVYNDESRQQESGLSVNANNVIISRDTTNRRFQLEPMETSFRDELNGSQSTQVKVLGSYYPKGIYRRPANDSELMMRVAPGTIFTLDGELNDWYRIRTLQGVGYLRQVDGLAISK